MLTDHPKRVCNSLQTLCALFNAVFRRNATETSFDVISTIFDFAEVEDRMKTLITKCNHLIISDVVDTPRLMCLKLLLVSITATLNIYNLYLPVSSIFVSFFFLHLPLTGASDRLQQCKSKHSPRIYYDQQSIV